jgi:chromosome segregation ATPase
MSRSRSIIARVLALAVLAPAALPAAEDEQAAVVMKLRDSLRSTMLQLRTAESDKAALQASKAELEQKLAQLTTELQQVSKEASSAKIEADKTGKQLRDKLALTEDERERYRESLAKWQTGYSQLAEAAKGKESERARLAQEVAVLKRKVEDMRSRNVALYQVGREILDRYAEFSMGDALKAREPFTGIKRARLEAQVDEWEVKIEEQRLKEQAAAAAAATPAADQKAKP